MDNNNTAIVDEQPVAKKKLIRFKKPTFSGVRSAAIMTKDVIIVACVVFTAFAVGGNK